ncbi:hypothetical protein BDQ17DRAFT_1484314 [Cyathus striatus]|nr:hypothetical protein BDQ17DRAFT_1484314 [Cyathus striatus]
MFIPQQPYLPWKISMTIVHAVAIATACFRIEYRRRSRRLWWDDYAAAVPPVSECITVGVLWLRLRHFSDEEDVQLRQLKINLRFTNAVSFHTTLWWPRISMALALVRITPEWSKFRLITLSAAPTIFVIWAAFVVLCTLPCALNTVWENANTDVLRHLIRVVFSTSLLTLVVTVVILITIYAGVIDGPGASVVWATVVQTEEALSVIASNLTVLISWGYKAFAGGEDIDAESNTHITPHWTFPLSSNLPPLNSLPTTYNQTPSPENCSLSAPNSLPRNLGSQ